MAAGEPALAGLGGALARWISDGPRRVALGAGGSPEGVRLKVNLLCDLGDLEGALEAIAAHEPAHGRAALYRVLALAAALRGDDDAVARGLAGGREGDAFVQTKAAYAAAGYAAAGAWDRAWSELAAVEASCCSSGSSDLIRAAAAACGAAAGGEPPSMQ